MKVIILAAGAAKRLRPLTNELPKCLLEVGGKAIIDYQMENLRKANLTEIIVVIGFYGEKIQRHLMEHHPDLHFTFIENENYENTYPAYGLWLARTYLSGEILYLNADVICDPTIIQMITDSPHKSVTAAQKTNWDEEEVNVIVDNDMRVLEMGKHISRELSYGEFIGVTKIGHSFNEQLKGVLNDFVACNELQKFAADALNLTIQRGETMYALDVSDKAAIEIDTPEDLTRAHEKIEHIIW